MLLRSPSGSLCPYFYMGGEIHPLKYGSYFDDKEALFKVIQAEQTFILKSPGTYNRRIWIDLYETSLDNDVIVVLAEHIQAIREKIFKLCFAGCSGRDEKKIIKVLKARDMDIASQVRFFSDPEDAKKWLIGEIH